KPFAANGRDYPAGSWVVLMDQPFAPLAKELFEAQRYPDLRESPNGAPILPYDVAGWNLPMQKGVEGSAAAPTGRPRASSGGEGDRRRRIGLGGSAGERLSLRDQPQFKCVGRRNE